MKRPGRRKPRERIIASPMERGAEHLAVTLTVPGDVAIHALWSQLMQKVPKAMLAHPEQKVEFKIEDVEFGHVLVRATVQRPRALSDGTTEEVRYSLLNSEPVIFPESSNNDDEVPF